ncbi:hypothetical protein [Streptomyces sp. NPDC002386]
MVPSLVVLAGANSLVPPATAEEPARRGFEVRRVPGAGHTL